MRVTRSQHLSTMRPWLLVATGVKSYLLTSSPPPNTLLQRSNRISLQVDGVTRKPCVQSRRARRRGHRSHRAAVQGISPTPGKGLGVFAAAPIEPNTWICDYQGEIITDEESDKRYKNAATGSGKGDYIFRLTLKTETEPGLCVDAQDSSTFRVTSTTRSMAI